MTDNAWRRSRARCGVDCLWQGQRVGLEREDGDLYVVVGNPAGDRMRARIAEHEAQILAAVLAAATARERS